MLCCCAMLLQVKWKDLVSDLNLVPTTLDEERTGAVDLGIGNLPLPFAKFKKSECVVTGSCLICQHQRTPIAKHAFMHCPSHVIITYTCAGHSNRIAIHPCHVMISVLHKVCCSCNAFLGPACK